MINILTPLYAYGLPRAAKGAFPYNHPTIAQIDQALGLNIKRKRSVVVPVAKGGDVG